MSYSTNPAKGAYFKKINALKEITEMEGFDALPNVYRRLRKMKVLSKSEYYLMFHIFNGMQTLKLIQKEAGGNYKTLRKDALKLYKLGLILIREKTYPGTKMRSSYRYIANSVENAFDLEKKMKVVKK